MKGVAAATSATAASVGFLRPRMGIGGSERLVTDAAVALTQRGHEVTLFVPDPDSLQFPELAEHRIRFESPGGFLPNHIAGRLQAPLAVARTAYAAWSMSRSRRKPDVIFSDVVPHVIPFAKRLTGSPVLYDCHYPDLLLTNVASRASAGYRAYRQPLDRLEVDGLAAADLVVANSRYTLSAVRASFPEVSSDRMTVLYPGVRVPACAPAWPESNSEVVFLSVNRFDSRKNLALAIDALAALRDRLPPADFSTVKLILAGHHDRGRPDAVAVVQELQQHARDASLERHVEFVFSPTEEEREALLARCRAVVYTPIAEHFGYGPVEAMAAGKPVVAVNSGGPAETVLHGETGFLCEPAADAFGAALATLTSERSRAERMGEAGHAHAARFFSSEAFGDGLESLIDRLHP